MSTEQQVEQAGVPTPTPGAADTTPHWGDAIPPERHEVLAALLQRWGQLSAAEQAERKGPFAKVELTGADVFSLALQALAGPDGDRSAWDAAAAQLRAAQDVRRSLGSVLDLSALHLECAVLRAAHLEEADLSQAHLEEADLRAAHLEGATLIRVHLEGATLGDAHLEHAYLPEAHLEGATLGDAHLEDAFLYEAHLEHAFLNAAHLERVNLRAAHLEDAQLVRAHLEGASLGWTSLERANLGWTSLAGATLNEAHLEDAFLYEAHLERTNLSAAHLERTNLVGASLERVNLYAAHLEGATLNEAHLEGATLRGASFDKASHLNDAVLTGASFDQVIFDNTNLTVVDWSLVDRLGDERTARMPTDGDGKRKDRDTRLAEFKAAVRANRVLAVTLQAQGLSEDASRFAYRAQRLQREVLRRQRRLPSYLGSLLLDVLAGYGYRPSRIFGAYVTVVLSFAAAYWAVTHFLETKLAQLSPDEALVLSLTSFHGRGFFPGFLALGDWVARLGAAEAVIGLFIELVLIATFSRRFLGT